MLTKKIKCPSCSYTTIVNGEPGDILSVTCDRCGRTGLFRFPSVDDIDTSQPGMIEVKHLVKRYGSKTVVNDVTFSVRRGEIFGFLGPNGAGKTTTIKAILGLIRIQSGDITVNGFDMRSECKRAKSCIGYLPERVSFYDNLTAMQNMLFYAEMKNAPKEECRALIEAFGLGDVANKRVGTFSKGMVQRLGMARAILGDPPVLILDEPTEGLDARGVFFLRNKIKDLKRHGTTIFLSSHILSEVQAVCDRVGIIDHGVLVAQDSVSNLSNKLDLKPKLVLELESVSDNIIQSLRGIDGVIDYKVINRIIHVTCKPNVYAKIIVAVVNAGGNIVNIQTLMPSLEEIFLRYTGSS
ncbi:MAG: ABC transporter ATP-binding protein [Candidatus Thermoplasmatota archaeon]